MPRTYSQLRWLGVDPQALQRLQRYVTLLPGRTSINVNTASREVIAAVLDVDLSTAERLVAERQRNPLGGPNDFENLLPTGTVVNPDRVSVSSTLFFVSGRVRLGDRIITERSLVERNGRNIDILSRERLTLVEQAR